MTAVIDIPSLVAPLSRMVPGPAVAGDGPLVDLAAGDLPALVDGLPAAAEAAVTGAAGTAVTRTLTYAGRRAVAVLDLSDDLERLADEAVAAVGRAAGDITVIAGQCVRQLVALVVDAPLSPATAVAAGAVAAEHRARAEARLTALGGELEDLTARVGVVDAQLPEPPAGPGTGPGTDPGPGAVAPPGAPPGAPPVAPAPEPPAASEEGVPAGTAGDVPGAPTPQAGAAVEAAQSALGTPYVWGGTTPGAGMDCSGLTQWAYAQAGVDIPRTADAQAVGPQVPADQLAPGDLAVWDGHVAMITGDGMMIEAGDPVQQSPVRTENIGMGFLGFYRPTG
ncbi:C40 family peptidase [Corynebacterium nuruki]|uniref:C40 family peptidase n=1 Tax=Corynebacterium nuruki TaxID=1032851 RepID=UPI0039BEDF5F